MSDAGQKWRVPKDIDRPLPFLMWELQDVVVGIGAMMMGVIFHHPLLGVAGLMAWLYYAKKSAQGAKRGQMNHSLWYHGGSFDPALKKHAPPATRKEYL